MKSIWKVMLAVCCLGMAIGCGTNPSKNENVKGNATGIGGQWYAADEYRRRHGGIARCQLWLASVLASFLQCLFGCLSGQ